MKPRGYLARDADHKGRSIWAVKVYAGGKAYTLRSDKGPKKAIALAQKHGYDVIVTKAMRHTLPPGLDLPEGVQPVVPRIEAP